MTLLNMANEAIPFAQSRLKKKKTPLQVNRILFGVQKYKGLDEAGLLSRIRSGITWTGSSTRCNPLISLLCTACPGSQVVPIWTSLNHSLMGCWLVADERLCTRALMCLLKELGDEAATTVWTEYFCSFLLLLPFFATRIDSLFSDSSRPRWPI